MLGVPHHVVADVKIEVPVVVQIGEGRRSGSIAHARQARALRDVFKRAVAPVAVERVGLRSRVTNRSGWPSLS